MITIDSFPIDATLTETHEFDSEVTDYPVESGSQITDNVRRKPIVVRIEGVVSNTPLSLMLQLRRNRGEITQGTELIPNSPLAVNITPATEALAKLLRIADNREPVDIVTALKAYSSMVMEKLSIPMSADIAADLHFTATFKQVVIVTNERTLVKQPAGVNGNGKARVGGNNKLLETSSTVYVISYPSVLRAANTRVHGPPVQIDKIPPKGGPAGSWDHYRVDPNTQAYDGVVVFLAEHANGDTETAFGNLIISDTGVRDATVEGRYIPDGGGFTVARDFTTSDWRQKNGQSASKALPQGTKSSDWQNMASKLLTGGL